MSITRIKVVARNLHPNASNEEKDRNFRVLHATFKKAVNDSGILTKFKEKQFFESKSEKRRRKSKEAALLKLRENFVSKENSEPPKEGFEL
jgi:ribosomal protein S21